MKDIDVSNIKYYVTLINEKGDKYAITNAITSLEWEEQKNELSQRATIKVVNTNIDKLSLLKLAKINCIIRIASDWGDGKKTIFEGTIWECQYESSRQKELTITAYDRLIRLQQSKDFKYYKPEKSTEDIIKDICNDWGITLDYKWENGVKHEKVFKAQKISDMIIETLEEVRRKTGKKYVVHFSDGKLKINGRGINNPVYKFDIKNTISTTNKLSINDLVTEVWIYGADSKDDERRSIEAKVSGDKSFGELREVILRDDNKDIEAAKSEAQTIINERGKPEEFTQVNVPDVPFIRKGDKVEISAGNLIGFFFVEGVTHNATSQKMTLTLDKADQSPEVETTVTEMGSAGVFNKGDAVILNGAVYVDSYGNGKGKTFTDYHSTITLVTPLDRACPYHIGAVGWVYPESIKKG